LLEISPDGYAESEKGKSLTSKKHISGPLLTHAIRFSITFNILMALQQKMGCKDHWKDITIRIIML